MSHPGFIPGDKTWRAASHALDQALDAALELAEIREQLAAKRIPAAAAKHAVTQNKAVLARFREEQERLDALRLSPDDVYVDLDADTDRLAARDVVWLSVIFLVGVAYLSLGRAAWTAMPWSARAFTFVGFLAVMGLSARWAVNTVPAVRAWFGLDAQQASPGSRREQMLQRVVLPELRQFIAGERKPLYDTVLTANSTPALYAEGDEMEIVVTASARHLQRILARAESGAVALAGNRGSGKTTAIHLVSRGLLSDPSSGHPPLAIHSSAPARYDARDFVLHLHALLCYAVLARLNPRFADSTPDGRERMALTRRRASWRRVRRVTMLALFTAGVIVGGGLMWDVSPPWDSMPRVWTLMDRIVTGRSPLTDLSTGEVVLVLGYVMVACYATVVVGDVLVAALGAVVRTMLRFVPRGGDRALLAKVTERQLDRIQFLQTYTAGWSGKVSAPLSGEAARTWSTQRARQRPTYPEVVEEFRRFAAYAAGQLKTLGMHDRFVISIDEVDKIGEPEKAHEFVNDIKGIFGVPGCLFLVSVSDDALTAFERRGIAVRDAFDSAFSEMVQVGYFTLAESRSWISRRVLDIPEQFSHLCHCLSGGLPRDLRRHTIEMLDVTAEVYHPTLAKVTNRLVRQELDRKAHAFAGTARTLDDSPALSDLMADLVTIRQTAKVDELVQLAGRLAYIPAGETAHPIDALRRQSGCFVLFCATLLEVFTDTLAEPDLVGLHELAVARQQMAIDSQLAWHLLTRFRTTMSLANPSVA